MSDQAVRSIVHTDPRIVPCFHELKPFTGTSSNDRQTGIRRVPSPWASLGATYIGQLAAECTEPARQCHAQRPSAVSGGNLWLSRFQPKESRTRISRPQPMSSAIGWPPLASFMGRRLLDVNFVSSGLAHRSRRVGSLPTKPPLPPGKDRN